MPGGPDSGVCPLPSSSCGFPFSLGSNDAVPPEFPAQALGSRDDGPPDAVAIKHREGIYSKSVAPKVAWTEELMGKPEAVKGNVSLFHFLLSIRLTIFFVPLASSTNGWCALCWQNQARTFESFPSQRLWKAQPSLVGMSKTQPLPLSDCPQQTI